MKFVYIFFLFFVSVRSHIADDPRYFLPSDSSDGSAHATPRDSSDGSGDVIPPDSSDGSAHATPRDSSDGSAHATPRFSEWAAPPSTPSDSSPKDYSDDDGDDDGDDEDSARERDPTSDGADSSGQSYAHDCDGKGVAYCSRPAVTETECPPMCVDCDEDQETSLTPIAKSKLFDYVYVYGGKVCLSHCHGRTKCNDWDVYGGYRHCKSIRCRDEEGLEGCQKKSAFVVPSCRDCELIFPRACTGHPVSSDSNDWGDSSEGWIGHRVYMKSAAPWGPAKNSTGLPYNKTFFNTSDWNETRATKSTLRFRVVP